MKIKFEDKDNLESKLATKDYMKLETIVKKNTVEMYNRSKNSSQPEKGGTPVETRELQLSSTTTLNGLESVVGYVKDYGPHVEYGHRTVNGGYVEGQHFLNNNLNIQKDIYYADLLKQLKKGK